MEKLDVVLVIRAIHKANTMGYDYVPVEVPKETAEMQLNKPEAQRNAAWRGVRYATKEEHDAHYGIQKEEKKASKEQLQEVENTDEEKTVKKIKKSKVEQL